MSDYLWDGTGEPEEDVKRLEELLGGLAYQPRPLELPEPLVRNASISRSFAWTRAAAIAAALILMLLAGAALMSIRRRAEAPVQQAGTQQPSPQQIETPRDGNGKTPKAREDVAVQPSSDPPEVKRRRRQSRPATSLAAASTNRRRQPTSRRLNETPAPVKEEIAQSSVPSRGRELTTEERRAKDQLMLALRLAGANLRYVQEQVREVGMTGKPR